MRVDVIYISTQMQRSSWRVCWVVDERELTRQSRYWTFEEHQRFLEAVALYGDKAVKEIAHYVGTRNMTQVHTHRQKWRLRLQKEHQSQEDMPGGPLDPHPFHQVLGELNQN
jgi:SHAQKYF class myb-like DNA-binding protein